jgi:two-component sensor histidine kinase
MKASGWAAAFFFVERDRHISVFALVLHEMMTNAAKYGCLSQPDGNLSVKWALGETGDCLIDWTETGGPSVAKPTRKGFGTNLIARTLSADLGGSVELEFLPSGLHARFCVPAVHLRAVVPAPPLELRSGSAPPLLTGLKRVASIRPHSLRL